MRPGDKPEFIHDFELDVCFNLSEALYYGPPDLAPVHHRKYELPLHRPDLPLRDGDVLLRHAIERADELFKYYDSVLAAAKMKRKELKPGAPPFWLRVAMFSAGKPLMSFAWHDTVKEARADLDALTASGDGVLVSDCEQSWELQVNGEGDRLVIREGPDEKETTTWVRCDRNAFIEQALEARLRLDEFMPKLVARYGVDWWNDPPR